MKNKKLKYIIIALILPVFFLSCKKYLDEKSNTSLVIPTTIENLQALLDFTDKINIVTPAYLEATTDDYFLQDADYNSLSLRDRSAYTWTPFEYNWINDWSEAYQPVYTSNLCLERLENIPRTILNFEAWNNVKGSCLFLRSYYFLFLAWQYSKAYDESTSQSDLGIPIRLKSDPNIPSVRASVRETYERVITDTKESIQYLPDNPLHVMRPSKAASYGLLARAYLSMRQYDSAFKYSNLCLGIKNSLLNFNSDISLGTTYHIPQFNKETIFYTEQTTNFVTPHYNFTALIDTFLFSSFNTNDLRKAAWVSPRNGYYKWRGSYTFSFRFFSGIATDEMFLVRAECYARKGDKTSALNDLNALLSTRWVTGTFVPITAADANDALTKILLERRKELLTRGLRWIDIKRFNKEGLNIILKRIVAGQTYTLPPNDNRYALPLPKDIIDQTGMLQNPQ